VAIDSSVHGGDTGNNGTTGTPAPLPGPTSDAPQAPRPRLIGALRENLQRFGLPVVWGLVALVFALVEPATFPTVGTFSTFSDPKASCW
jgi:hypothetical protein